MDRQIDADRACQIPLKVAEELDSKSFDLFLTKDKEYYINLFNTKNTIVLIKQWENIFMML